MSVQPKPQDSLCGWICTHSQNTATGAEETAQLLEAHAIFAEDQR